MIQGVILVNIPVSELILVKEVSLLHKLQSLKLTRQHLQFKEIGKNSSDVHIPQVFWLQMFTIQQKVKTFIQADRHSLLPKKGLHFMRELFQRTLLQLHLKQASARICKTFQDKCAQ